MIRETPLTFLVSVTFISCFGLIYSVLRNIILADNFQMLLVLALSPWIYVLVQT